MVNPDQSRGAIQCPEYCASWDQRGDGAVEPYAAGDPQGTAPTSDRDGARQSYGIRSRGSRRCYANLRIQTDRSDMARQRHNSPAHLASQVRCPWVGASEHCGSPRHQVSAPCRSRRRPRGGRDHAARPSPSRVGCRRMGRRNSVRGFTGRQQILVRQTVDMRGDDRPGAPDGMKVDEDGRLWTTGAGGVWVLEPDGSRASGQQAGATHRSLPSSARRGTHATVAVPTDIGQSALQHALSATPRLLLCYQKMSFARMSRGETLVLVMQPAQDRPTHDLALAPGR